MHTAQQLAGALSGPIARGRTIVLVTHHVSLCLPIASYFVELSRGKVLRHGSVQELRQQGVLDEVVKTEDVVVDEESAEPEAVLLNEADIGDVQKVGNTNGKLIEAEARAEGRVSFRTYVTYIRAAGIWAWFVTLFLMIAIRLINVANQVRR
jgi:ABC-type multidrug transport system ATPase subunit